MLKFKGAGRPKHWNKILSKEAQIIYCRCHCLYLCCIFAKILVEILKHKNTKAWKYEISFKKHFTPLCNTKAGRQRLYCSPLLLLFMIFALIFRRALSVAAHQAAGQETLLLGVIYLPAASKTRPRPPRSRPLPTTTPASLPWRTRTTRRSSPIKRCPAPPTRPVPLGHCSPVLPVPASEVPLGPPVTAAMLMQPPRPPTRQAQQTKGWKAPSLLKYCVICCAIMLIWLFLWTTSFRTQTLRHW